jgi:hypothetical protein
MNNGSAAFRRYIPLACWVVVLVAALYIALRIVSYAYLPSGDARRHVAKPFAGKPYSEILVLRPQYTVDHSPGWEWLMGALHRVFAWGEDGLMTFSLISLMLVIFCLPLAWLRRPEAWLGAILAEMIAIPELMTRWTQARPYLITEGVLMAVLLAWTSGEARKPGWKKLVLTTAGIGLAVWMHGSWYLWILPVAAFCLAQRRRDGLALAACWLAGAAGAALLTGHPFAFLREAIFITQAVSREHLPGWMLVGEFRPSDGEFSTLVLLALVYLWAGWRNLLRRPLLLDPVFWMIAMNWTLGFYADRFWADFGMPAALVWMALRFDDGLPSAAAEGSLQRLLLCATIAVALAIDATNDLGRRYTACLDEIFIDANDPKLAGWLPGKGGIFYADNMKFFYNTFYKNPAADWRYVAGFEPALMPEEDLKVYRDIQRSRRAPETFDPWIKKMRPEDRLEMESPSQPDLPALEWIHAGNIWIGRRPAVNH